MNEQLRQYLEDEMNFDLVEIPGKGVCGLRHFIFTVGLIVGMDYTGYDHRYCYERLADAKQALSKWKELADAGKDIPTDPDDEHWIKRKGHGERSNPRYRKEGNF